MSDILASAKTSTPPLLPVRADVDLPFSSRATSLPQEPEPEPAIPPPIGNKKRGSKSLIMAVLLFLLATLPLTVYFTSQQRQVADIRNRAACKMQPQYRQPCIVNGKSYTAHGSCFLGYIEQCDSEASTTTPQQPTSPPSQSTSPEQTNSGSGTGSNGSSGCSNGGRYCDGFTCTDGTNYDSDDCYGGGDCSNRYSVCGSAGVRSGNTTTITSAPSTGVGSAPPSVQVTPIPDTFQGGEGSCDPGGQDHIYNQCCGEGLSKRVIRSCTNAGKFVWAIGACDQQDNACKTSNPTSVTCASNETYVNGTCYPANGGCVPVCSGKSCGANDGCSGVCTESCTTQSEAEQMSARGPIGGGIINSGNANSGACNNTTGVCQAGSGQTLKLCSCSAPSVGPQAAQCNQNCQTITTGAATCQSEADKLCKTIQLDVLAGSQLIDTIVCNPSNPSTCAGGGTGGGGTTTTSSGGNPPGGSLPTATPIPTPVPGGTCELIKLYDNSGTDITVAVKNGTKKLAIGEQVTIATTKGNATKARFRIQGIADWAENDPAKTTATEYRLSINIPSTLTQSQGTFEVEVLVNGVWK